MPKIKIVKVDTLPLCPHCEKQLSTIEKIDNGFFHKNVIYICPYCKKIISIGYDDL